MLGPSSKPRPRFDGFWSIPTWKITELSQASYPPDTDLPGIVSLTCSPWHVPPVPPRRRDLRNSWTLTCNRMEKNGKLRMENYTQWGSQRNVCWKQITMGRCAFRKSQKSVQNYANQQGRQWISRQESGAFLRSSKWKIGIGSHQQ